MSDISCALPCVVWHDDDPAIYLHLSTNKIDYQDQWGNVIFDFDDDGVVVGAEMLSLPKGDFSPIHPDTWVLIGRAWERAAKMRSEPGGAHRGEFTIR